MCPALQDGVITVCPPETRKTGTNSMPPNAPLLNATSETIRTLIHNGSQFLSDTTQLAKTDPIAAGGRCIGAGLATAAAGAATFAVGAMLDTLGTAAMVFGGAALVLTEEKKAGVKMFTYGAGAFALGKVLVAGGAVAVITGGATAVAGTGLVAYSARKKPSKHERKHKKNQATYVHTRSQRKRNGPQRSAKEKRCASKPPRHSKSASRKRERPSATRTLESLRPTTFRQAKSTGLLVGKPAETTVG